MGISGSSVNSPNRRLHFFGIIFLGIIAFAAVLYWREKSLMASEYVEFPQHQNLKKKSESGSMRSKNFQIDTEDVSPTVK